MAQTETHDQYTLPSQLTDDELLAQIDTLAACSRQATANLVAHLAELDQRRLFLGLGFSSLFAYCVEHLRLSEQAAYRRIASARVAQHHPDVLQYLARGELHLSAICAFAPFARRDDAPELLRSFLGKTRREIDRLLAARFPRPDVPPRVSPSSSGRHTVTFSASTAFCELLQRAMELMSHRLQPGDLEGLFGEALRALVDKLMKQRYGFGTRGRSSGKRRRDGSSASSGAVTSSAQEDEDGVSTVAEPRRKTSPSDARASRKEPVGEVRRALWKRDDGRCAYVSPDGRRCNERRWLEFDHRLPRAMGGDESLDNMQLFCRAHNQLRARQQFGPPPRRWALPRDSR